MKRRIKNTAQLKIFITLLLVSIILILYLLLISDVNAEMLDKGINYVYIPFKSEIIILFIITAILAYTASSIIIDRILNPIRIMISKVNDIGNMNFSKPLVIRSEDEELREYVIAFNNMSEKLSNYIEQQKRFISDASHELVTPITVINGHANLLLRHGKRQPELLESGLNTIQSEALKMDELIDNLLLLARSDSKKQIYNFEYVSVSRLITESIIEAELIAPDFHFEFFIDQEVNIKCDEYAIRRVLRIILSNAVKYSGDSNTIQIIAYKSHELINIQIKDNGIGISTENQAHIFDRFYRVDDSRSKQSGGTGLGLSIAKEIILAHGGNIQVSGEINIGTVFTITLSV